MSKQETTAIASIGKAPPCPECNGEVIMRTDGTQNCSDCSWWWLPPSKRPLVLRRMATMVRLTDG